MLSKEEKQDVLARHPTGFAGIWKGYGRRRIFKSGVFWTSLGISILVSVFIAIYVKEAAFNIISSLIDIAIQFMPVLLGFNLGGYALIIGFGNTTLIKKLTTDFEEKKSMFQLTSAVFSFSVIVQSVALLLTFLFWVIKLLNANILITDDCIQWLGLPVNILGIFLLSFLLFYSLLLVPQMIVNVFTFGQLHHFVLYTERITEQKKKVSTPAKVKDAGEID